MKVQRVGPSVLFLSILATQTTCQKIIGIGETIEVDALASADASTGPL